MKILLVDDNEDEKQEFAEAIEKLGLDIEMLYARDAKELFDYLEKETNINLIFLDINLPVMDGKKCLKELKSNEKYNHIPVLVYTVSQSIEDIEEVFQGGAHYYAVKPYARVNFMETLKLIFGIDWTVEQSIPPREQFVINLAFI